MRNFYLRELGPRDAALIGDAEALIYGSENPGLINGTEDFRAELSEAEEADQGFSVGVFDNDSGRLIAYMICYRKQSDFNCGDVAYISDIAVFEDCRGTLHHPREGNLFTTMLRWLAGHTLRLRLPIEAECRTRIRDLLRKHPHLPGNFGYLLVHERFLPEYFGGEDFFWLRFEVDT